MDLESLRVLRMMHEASHTFLDGGAGAPVHLTKISTHNIYLGTVLRAQRAVLHHVQMSQVGYACAEAARY